MAHYFDASGVKSKQVDIRIMFQGREFSFISDNGVFSKYGLDEGSGILIKTVLDLNLSKSKCVDVGCGYGAIGIILNTLNKNLSFDYLDINERATKLTKKNIEKNNLEGNIYLSDCLDAVILNKYDVVISNPPIRAGNTVLYKIFSQSYEVLNKGGKFICVLRAKQGAKTYIKHIEEIYGNSNILQKDKGFIVCEFIKE